ncbi:phage baseplate assembly protein V [Sphingomonas parapaucimobilis]|uniref:phage baseplate assembly protein V n=1 Tax=Sphingomonas parapaucimobilis TaxID=28213 RepID=UPI0032192536
MVAVMADPADIQRLVGDLLREGLVASVDHEAGTCTVELSDDLTTGAIPFLSPRMGEVRIWLPPSIGEQVLLIAPDAMRGSIGRWTLQRLDIPGSKRLPDVIAADIAAGRGRFA